MRRTGPIAWMARNGVAANLLMLFIIIAGLSSSLTITQKVFPEFSLGQIEIQVPYPGADPLEIEEAVVRRIEEQVEGIEGIDQIRATAAENLANVTIEFKRGVDINVKLDEVKNQVDRITSLPEEAEEPVIQEVTNRRRVVELVLYGDVPEETLKAWAYRAKDALTASSAISFAELTGVRADEVSIEVSNDALRALGLSLVEVAEIVRRNSQELPGGDIETDRESIRVRTLGRNYTRSDFAEIVLLTDSRGGQVRLGEVAEIEDGLSDSDLITRFQGQPAVFIQVFRIGAEQVLSVVDETRRYLEEELRPQLPAAIQADLWRDDSQELRGRLGLLLKNGLLGLGLVVLALALFLNLRLAFWTAAGIFIAFVGAFAILTLLDRSINQISLFGFILAIGIVVDDAIVTGENIYAERERGGNPLAAAIDGAQRVARPVIFAVFTTIAAFVPLLFMPGSLGNFLLDIPIVVISVLALSLVESLLVLPHHLAAGQSSPPTGRYSLLGGFHRLQRGVDRALKGFIDGPLHHAVSFAVHHYGVVIASSAAALLAVFGLLQGGYVQFAFFPSIESRYVTAELEMAAGTRAEATLATAQEIEAVGRQVAAAVGREQGVEGSIVTGVYLSVGQAGSRGGPADGGSGIQEANTAAVIFELIKPEERDFSARLFEARWRDAVGDIPGVRKLNFSASLVDLGEPVQLELAAADEGELDRAVAAVEAALREQPGVFDIRNDDDAGKREVLLSLTPFARTLGLTVEELARQIRAAFFGAEALRIQRGREELKVYVRLPEAERNALSDLADYRIRTASGSVPLQEVATLRYGQSPTTITRRDGRRVVTVTADLDLSVTTGQTVAARLRQGVLAELPQDIRGFEVRFGGEQREQGEALPALARNFVLALFSIYALLAIAFRSYLLPLVVLAAIPFGLIGAVVGHFLLGLNLTILSIFGVVGLSGVIINDALVLIDFANEAQRSGMAHKEAVLTAAKSRFRPIMLTSLTTFLGIFPLVIERSLPALGLIPLAVSIGFGVVLGTLVLLLLVPALAALPLFAKAGADKEAGLAHPAGDS